MKHCALLLLLVVGLSFGCKSTDPDKFGPMLKEWVPIGTTTAEAKRIMKSHGFECVVVAKDNVFNHTGLEILDCDKEAVWLHTWHAEFILKDGKVFAYGDATVENQR